MQQQQQHKRDGIEVGLRMRSRTEKLKCTNDDEEDAAAMNEKWDMTNSDARKMSTLFQLVGNPECAQYLIFRFLKNERKETAKFLFSLIFAGSGESNTQLNQLLRISN